MNWCSKMADGMDYEHHGAGSSKHLITFEEGSNKPEPIVPENPKKESRESSFSSESSIEYKDDETFDHTNPFLQPEHAKTGSQAPVFYAESAAQNPRINLQELPTLSTQAMPGSYDPGRIPASVFSSKPATPMEWSVASNESLFSIHVGNSSFSRDHVFMLFKSGELAKLDDYVSVPPSGYPGIESDKAEQESIDLWKDLDQNEEKFGTNTKSQLAQSMKISRELSTKSTPKSNQLDAQKKTSHDCMPLSHEEVRNSTSSVQSFQFPLLDSDIGKDASVKVGAHKQNSERKTHQEMQLQNHGTTTTTKPGWFSCFTCCSLGGC